MKIAIVMICTRNLNFGKYVIDNVREYCDRHGYDFILYEDILDPTSAIITNKTISVLKNIKKYDWILMKDADSLFYNFNFKIEDYIDNNYNYIGSWSKNVGKINLGHLLIKCTLEVMMELESVLKVLRERVVVKGEQPIYNMFWNEGRMSPVKQLPKHIFNAHAIGKKNWKGEWCLPIKDLEKLNQKDIETYEKYADIFEDTFIVHYPGVFLKTADYIYERYVSMGRYPEPFSFSESYLLEFIHMCDKIKISNHVGDREYPELFLPKFNSMRNKMNKFTCTSPIDVELESHEPRIKKQK